MPNAAFQLGPWVVTPLRNTLASVDKSVKLEPRVMNVLVYLADHAQEVVSRTKILETVWEGSFVNDEVLTSAIRKLRKALGDDARDPRFIQTISGKGYRLNAVVRSVTGQNLPTGSPRRSQKLVGREEEQAKVRSFIDQSRLGRGGLLFIGGEPGIGKTRLSTEMLALAREKEALALVGRCHEREDAIPYLPFVEIMEQAARIVPRESFREALGDAASEVARLMPELRRLFPDIPAPTELPPEQRRRYLFNSYLEFLERGSRIAPMVLLLDDLQWADEATLSLMQHLAPHLGEMPVLVLGAYRDAELDLARPFGGAMETLVRNRIAERFVLKRLSEESVGELLGSLAGRKPPVETSRVVYDATEGNPFFVEELFKHLSVEGRLFDATGQWQRSLPREDLDVPDGARMVIDRRLAWLSEAVPPILTVGAVIGRQFSVTLLDASVNLGTDAVLDALEEAERAHLISSQSNLGEAEYVFDHDLIRQTLEEKLSLPRRQRMHLRVAEAIERLYGSSNPEHTTDLAHHLYRAGANADPQKTIHHLVAAGQQALEAVAAEDALRYYEAALTLVPAEDNELKGAMFYERARAHRALGQWDQALSDWLMALPFFEEQKRKARVCDICESVASLFMWQLHFADAVSVAHRGLAAMGERTSVERCRLLGAAGSSQAMGGEWVEGEALMRQAIEMAEDIGDPHLIAESLMRQNYVSLTYLLVPRLLDGGRRAANLAQKADDPWTYVDALSVIQGGLMFQGHFEEIIRMSEESEPLASRLGHVGALTNALSDRMFAELMRTARFDVFESLVQEYLDIHSRAGLQFQYLSFTYLGYSQLWRGRWEEALHSFEKGLGFESAVFSGFVWGGLLLIKAYRGDSDVRAIWEERKTVELPEAGRANLAGRWGFLLAGVEGLAQIGERSEAGKYYPLVLEALETGSVAGAFFPTGLLRKIAGIAAAAGKNWKQAVEHFEIALRQADELPHRIDQPEVRRWYAWTLMERSRPGDLEMARRLLTEALAAYLEMGMSEHEAMARQLLEAS